MSGESKGDSKGGIKGGIKGSTRAAAHPMPTTVQYYSQSPSPRPNSLTLGYECSPTARGSYRGGGMIHINVQTLGIQPAVIYEDTMLAPATGQTEINRPTR